MSSEEGGELARFVVDVQGFDSLETSVDSNPSFEGQEYQNGIPVLTGTLESPSLYCYSDCPACVCVCVCGYAASM